MGGINFKQIDSGALHVVDGYDNILAEFGGDVVGSTDGGVGAVPVASQTAGVSVREIGNGAMRKTVFTFTDVEIAVTDGAGSGSHGSLQIYDAPEGNIIILGGQANITMDNPDGTGVPDDTVMEVGVGSTAISAAADGSLGSTEDDIVPDINLTLSSGTASGSNSQSTSAAFDGTGTAMNWYFNFSGTAATVDDDGTIEANGTVVVLWTSLGDD